MIISIDTEALRQMAELAANCNLIIEESVKRMNMVIEHDDWNCKERDKINECIIQNKSKQKMIAERMVEFSSYMSNTSGIFSDTEEAIPHNFQHIDTMIASALALQGGNNVVSLTSDVKTVCDSVRNDAVLNDSIQSYSLDNLSNNINICEFSSFDFDNKD